MLKGKTIAIDFDGVLNQYQGWVQGAPIPEPAPDALFFLTELASEATVIIFTCRETREVWDWLHHHQMERLVSHVTNTKPAAFCYVDDRAICHQGDLVSTLEQIKTFEPHWKKDEGRLWTSRQHDGGTTG